jgi:hypothetical protein
MKHQRLSGLLAPGLASNARKNLPEINAEATISLKNLLLIDAAMRAVVDHGARQIIDNKWDGLYRQPARLDLVFQS